NGHVGMAVKYDSTGVNQETGIHRRRTAPLEYSRQRVAAYDFHDPIPLNDGIGGSIAGRWGGENLEKPCIGSCLGGGKSFDVAGKRCTHSNLNHLWQHRICIACSRVRLNVEGLSRGPNRCRPIESPVSEESDDW